MMSVYHYPQEADPGTYERPTIFWPVRIDCTDLAHDRGLMFRWMSWDGKLYSYEILVLTERWESVMRADPKRHEFRVADLEEAGAMYAEALATAHRPEGLPLR